MSKEMLELVDRLERQAKLRCLGLDTQELLQQAAAALRASAVAEPARLREALEKIGGDREYSSADIASHAQKPHKTIDESVAEDALASLPAPAAAPTREEIAKRLMEFDDLRLWELTDIEVAEYRRRANAILALKAAPAK